jgi:pimeloyl-ACP methyl ester carboxylesterase
MKKAVVTLLMALISIISFSQEITGHWNGLLKVQGTQLKLVFNITKTEKGLVATMDSPDQGANDIPVTTVSFEDSALKMTIANASIEYEGTLGKDRLITGNFKQGGQSFPLNLSEREIRAEKPLRPQEPLQPFSYYSEEVIFENKQAGITLAGTLTLPKKAGNFPVVILISGSGPHNRNEEILGHKPFLVLSDYLTKNGIAVLRFDDRGVAASKGDFGPATSLDFASDVEAGVKYLQTRKEINKKKIGLMGHSEGGIIAPLVASTCKDVSYIALLAGPGLPGDELIVLQLQLLGKASGKSETEHSKEADFRKGAFAIIKAASNQEQLKMDLTAYIIKSLNENPNSQKPEGMSDEELGKIIYGQIASPWMQYFLRYNPAAVLEKVKCPVLAINGDKDSQVPSKQNLTAIKDALRKGGNKNATIKELPGMNHLFQECKTGLSDEYGIIEQTFSPIALTEILTWVKSVTK